MAKKNKKKKNHQFVLEPLSVHPGYETFMLTVSMKPYCCETLGTLKMSNFHFLYNFTY